MIKNISRPVKSIIAAAGAVGILALGGALPAFASGNTTATISGSAPSGGTLTPGNFGDITITGLTSTQTADATFGIGNITDASGTGHGWNLTFGMTQLTDAASDALAVGSVTIKTAPQLTVATTGSSDPTTINATKPALSTALDSVAGTPVTLFTAGKNDGMGSYSSSSLVVTLTVPVTVHAGAYASTATVTLNQTNL